MISKSILFLTGVSLSMVAFWALTKETKKNLYPASTLTSKNKETVPAPPDSSKKNKKPAPSRPTFTPDDRYGDEYSNPSSSTPFILGKPSNIQTDVQLDTSMENYTIQEKVGQMEYRPPTTMTFQEYSNYRNQQMMKNYWKNRSGGTEKALSTSNKKGTKLMIPVRGLKGPFGSDYVSIVPNGLVTLNFAGQWQRLANPNIPIRQQKNGNFNFEQNVTLNVVGQIGDKLKLTTNWDTKATFDYQNNVKINYTSHPEDIIQKIEAGTVSMPTTGTLIQSPQNLFGLKAKLQFGRLGVTAIAANQRGQIDQITLQGGGQSRTFDIKADNYDDYRHFFLGQFFRDHYEQSLAATPNVLSGLQITRVDVYITNTVNNTSTLRDMLAFTDLGEAWMDSLNENKNFDKLINPRNSRATPYDSACSNTINNLYNFIKGEDSAEVRNPNTAPGFLESQFGMAQSIDFEVINRVRKLASTEYTFNANLGYISLVTQLKPTEALGVAYQYTYKGKTYTVGELNGEISNVANNQLIILKLLKPQTINLKLNTWNLMMKNIYSLGATNLVNTNFQCRVVYKNDQSGEDIPNLQQGEQTNGVPLLRLMGLDRLNVNNDPIPDGNFDYIEGVTIDSKNGKIIIPKVEPFGQNLRKYFNPGSEVNLIAKYVYQALYDSTKSAAQMVTAQDKYFFTGSYQAGTAGQITLPGINISPGSVQVMAGSTALVEGTDYTVDYNLGRLNIINQGVLSSGQTIVIRFEKQDLFNFRRRTFIGTRFDYKVSKGFMLGATMYHQKESPQITRVNVGDEPSNNTMLGADMSYQKDSRLLTKMVDRLPIIQTKAPSSINFFGEGADLIPGHPKFIDKGEKGVAYIDDFEGAETPYDFTRLPSLWNISATPQRFKEAADTAVALSYSFHRAKFAWYNIDQTFYRTAGDGKPAEITTTDMDNHFVRYIQQQEIFPNLNPQSYTQNEITLDMAFFPSERGPYNYNPALNTFAKNPQKNWGGITRAVRSDIDFDNANIQYIEFWMMSPYRPANSSSTNYDLPIHSNRAANVPFTGKGKLYFNLGSISEDLEENHLQDFENGLPAGVDTAAGQIVKTVWGETTTQPFVTDAFASDPASRGRQDVGLDGINDNEEKLFFSSYLKSIAAETGISAGMKDSIAADPSGDNFNYFLGATDDDSNWTVVQRYKSYNGMENNSPIASTGLYTPSNSTLPDNEDLNSNNTLDNLDQYYEYEIDIDPSKMVVGQNNIVGQQIATVTSSTGTVDHVTWLQFRIPIRQPDSVVGGIVGYKSIRFFRTYMTGFTQPVILRLAEFQMVSDQWRVYLGEDLDSSGQLAQYKMVPQTVVSTVNIQENNEGTSATSPYVTPPGFQQDIDPTSTVTRLLNEQSLKLSVANLNQGQVRAVYKNVTLNLLNYGEIRAFIHAETSMLPVINQSVIAFLRLGTDFNQNFYEIEVPLYFTNPINPGNNPDPNLVWLEQNWIQQSLGDLVQAKLNRDASTGYSLYLNYTYLINGRNITVHGNPDLSSVQTIMLGIRNPKNGPQEFASLNIWVDELRVSDFHQKSAYAAAGKANMKLADLANVTLSGRVQTPGFGPIDQSVSEQDRTTTAQWGVMSNITLDKFIPKNWGLKLPMYVSYNTTTIKPKYNPLDPDVLMSQALNLYPESERAYYKKVVLDQSNTKSINFTNIQKIRMKKDAKMHPWDIENFTFSTAYTGTNHHNATLANYFQKTYNEALGYSFTNKAKPIEPFKNLQFLKSPYLRLIKDFNFNALPSTLTFRTTVNRQITATQYWGGSPIQFLGGGSTVTQNPFYQAPEAPLYQKLFTFTRNYGVNWTITKSLSMEYSAAVNGVIDEPGRSPDHSKEYRDSILSNIKRLGRVKNLNQQVGFNYTLPLDKFPMTNWMTATARYSAGYTWTSGALYIRDTLGNQIQNNRTMGVTGALNMDKLYNKLKILQKINAPPAIKKTKIAGPPGVKPNPKDSTNKNVLPKKELRALKAAVRTLMALKNINYQFSDVQSTSMAGFLEIPKYLGMSEGKHNTDMIPFLLGSQNPEFRHTVSKNGWESQSASLNTPFTQTTSISFDIKTSLEPIPDFKIQLEATKATTQTYNEFYRVANSNDNEFVSQSPYSSGSYKLSFISIASAFEGKEKSQLGVDPYASKAFHNFQEDRFTIWNRLGHGAGYDTNSQNILIPAFLAAYSGQNANKTSLSGVPSIPLPNWSINYTGLTRIAAIKKYFTRFNLTHKYSSTYNTGNYTSNLDYSFNNPNMSIVNAPLPTYISNGSIAPVFIVDNVTITESFSPLLGADFTTKSKLNGSLSYGRDRTLTLSIANSQVQEMVNNRITINIGTNKSGIKLPFNRRQPVILKNEVQAMLNMTINDTRTIMRPLDGLSTVTAGNLNLQLKPTIGYSVSQKVNISMYFERTINAPKVSSSYKRTTTAFGFLVRFTLS